MTSITIITIVVVALLTILIFGLLWLGYTSTLRTYRAELRAGKHDRELIKEYRNKKRHILGVILSCLIVVLLLSLLICGIVSRINNDTIMIGNKTVLVIKSNSMSDFYNIQYAEELGNDRSLHFSFGDICLFEKVAEDAELVEGDVYGYRYNNYIITHRLVRAYENDSYEFRGDNNQTSDPYRIKRGNILYHYTGKRAAGVGAFVLFAQSYFGLWSIFGFIGVVISNEIICHKIDKLNKERYALIRGISLCVR